MTSNEPKNQTANLEESQQTNSQININTLNSINQNVNVMTYSDGTFAWPMKAVEYNVDNCILGKGASATVHKAELISDPNRTCAIKKINLEEVSDESSVLKEIKTLSSFKHDNITGYFGCFLNKSKLWIVMELMDGASIFAILNSLEQEHIDRRPYLRENELVDSLINENYLALIVREVLKGLIYLHDQMSCIHRDIKAQNILLNKKGQVKLADFGVSSLAKAKPKTFVGTPCWMAPEVSDAENYKQGYDAKADCWSLGITILEMITGRPPNIELAPIKVILMTIQMPPPECKNFCSQKGFRTSRDLQKLVEHCLKKDPNQRASAAQILKHDSFINSSKLGRAKADPSEQLRNFLQDGGKYIKPGKVVKTTMSRDKEGFLKFDFGTDDESERSSQAQIDFNEQQMQNLNINSGDQPNQETNSEMSLSQNPNLPDIIPLILRIRMDGQQLNDIRFPFEVAKDTPKSMAAELAENQLISHHDKITVAFAMEECITNGEGQIFRLHGFADDQIDPEKLIGYAKISLENVIG